MESSDEATLMDGETERGGKKSGETMSGGVMIGKTLRRSMKETVVEERTGMREVATGWERRIPG